ncbi:MAG TPA: DUF4129 domain-containing protein [Acidimicrobiales bacterium]
MRTLRPRQAWGVGVLVAVAGLLGVVAVAADGSPLAAPLDPAGGGERLRAALSVVGLAAAALGVVVLVLVFTGERNRRPQFGRPPSFLRNLLAMILLAALAVAVIPLRRATEPATREPAAPPPATAAAGDSSDDGGVPWPVLALAGVVVSALGWAAWTARRRRASPSADITDTDTQRQAAGRAFDASLADLEAEPDPRRAIIAAYARLLDGLAACGLGRREAEAPEEHLRRALLALRVRADPMQVLVDLFGEARFSEHVLTADDKAAAIDAFRAARNDLVPHLVPS